MADFRPMNIARSGSRVPVVRRLMLVRRGTLLFTSVALISISCSSEPEPSAAPEKRALSGTLDARGDCIAAGNGYEIVVTDESNKIVATVTTDEFPTNPNSPDNVCEAVPFSVEVPVREFYTLEIGVHEAPTWSRTDLSEATWEVDLLLNVDDCDFVIQDCDYLGTSPFYEQQPSA